jgi:hypothetical protein
MLVISKQISKAVLVILKQTAQKCGISTWNTAAFCGLVVFVFTASQRYLQLYEFTHKVRQRNLTASKQLTVLYIKTTSLF